MTHTICLGTQHLGASLTDEGEAHALLDQYVALGGQLLDTAPDFGQGRAQHIVGRWLAARPHAPLALSTKFGFAPDRLRSDPATLRDALARSLDALGVEQVALLWCQGWDGHTPLDALLDALTAACEDGSTKGFALTDWPAWAAATLIERARARGLPGPAALQLEYGLLARGVEHDLLPLARHAGLAVFAWGTTSGGALTDEPPTGYYAHALTPGWQRRRDLLHQLARDRAVSPASLANAWVIAHGCTANIGPASAQLLASAWPAAPIDDEALAALNACAPAPGFPQRYWASLY
jgi:aryl-alcohol dehydrogenase-like predicted oxidoreductase